MSWMAIDDQLHASRKFRKLRADRWRCTGFWVTCGSWCRAEMTDGFVPDYVVDEWDPGHDMATRLVEVGLWKRSEHDGEPGYQFHDWFDYNLPVAEIIKKREANARRQAKWRERQRGGDGRFTPDDPGGGGGSQQTLGIVPTDESAGNGRVPRGTSVSNTSRNVLSNAVVIPPPTPTPTQLKKKTCARTARDTAGPDFEQWYAAYPRRKAPEAAAKAYLKARRLVSHEALMVATQRFARERHGQDVRYTPYPATWLNAGSWADETDRTRPASRLMDL